MGEELALPAVVSSSHNGVEGMFEHATKENVLHPINALVHMVFTLHALIVWFNRKIMLDTMTKYIVCCVHLPAFSTCNTLVCYFQQV